MSLTTKIKPSSDPGSCADPFAHRDRARRSRRRQLNEADLLPDPLTRILTEADLLRVERFGTVNIRHGYGHQFEFHIHSAVLPLGLGPCCTTVGATGPWPRILARLAPTRRGRVMNPTAQWWGQICP